MRNDTDPLTKALEDMRTALRGGDYAALPALAARIETLMLSLPRNDAAVLRRIRQQADSTGACLTAARNGFRAARRRIDELRAGTQALGTYDRSGSRAPLMQTASSQKRV